MTNKRMLFWAAVLSVFALLAHVIDAPDHLKEWWGYGTVFVIVASFQFFFGLALFVQPLPGSNTFMFSAIAVVPGPRSFW